MMRLMTRSKAALFLASTLFLFASGARPVRAHEGHGTPGALQAPHGGVMQSTPELFFELVSDSSGLKIFPMTHELVPVPPAEVTVSATSQAPKKKKEPVKLAASGDHWEAKVDAKGAYRYTLELQVQFKGKKRKVAFQVEPQG